MSFLKDHPFSVKAHFETSMVLTFAVAKEELEHWIPECLSLDLFDNKWAFVAVALVQTKELRPSIFPRFMGNDFFLIGYRIFVQYHNIHGKRLRGLYILKSETNKKKMEKLGSIFTQYSYSTTDILQSKNDNRYEVKSNKSRLHVIAELNHPNAPLPKDSPFNNWKEARRFAGPLPFTFTYKKEKKEVLIIEGKRENWTPNPVKIIQQDVGFIKELNFKSVNLANAFIIENIPYEWKKGKKEIWTP